MNRINLPILSIVILLLLVLTVSSAAPQAGTGRPLTWEQVLEYWKAEAAETLRRNITRERVVQNGVAFALNDVRERELQSLKMPADVINEIRRQNRTATLIIECEPDCSVSLDNVQAGKTSARQFTTTVIAGSVNVEVSAPPSYKAQKETVRITPGQVVRRTFQLELVKGSLDLRCEPDCVASVTGPNGFQRKLTTTKSQATLDELPDGEYIVRVEAEGFKSAESKFVARPANIVTTTFKLAVDEWAAKSAVDILELMTREVGAPRLVAYAVTSKNDGRMNIMGDPPGIGNWSADLVESTIPNKVRWELNITGRKWTVTFDGTTARSGGDRRYSGTPLASELEQSIRLFNELRLPAVLTKVRSGFDLRKELLNGASVLTASSDSDRYTFYVNDAFVPQRVIHERLVSPRSKAEMEFGQYRQLQPELRLPHLMILRYPDRPKHEPRFEYTAIDPGLALRDSYFARP
jgi:hypothetical protein